MVPQMARLSKGQYKEGKRYSKGKTPIQEKGKDTTKTASLKRPHSRYEGEDGDAPVDDYGSLWPSNFLVNGTEFDGSDLHLVDVIYHPRLVLLDLGECMLTM